MVNKEKGRLAGADLIPIDVRQDNSELIPQQHQYLQVARLIRRCALSAATADALAPLVFGEIAR